MIGDTIAGWSEADLRRYVVNLLLTDPGALPKTVGGAAQTLPSPASDSDLPVWNAAQNKWVAQHLVDAQVASNAALSPSKFAGYPTDIQKVLTGAGSWLGGMSTIYDSTSGGSVGSFDTGANGVPQTYAHLLCTWSVRTDRAVTFENIVLVMNNLTGATDYRWEQQSTATTVVAATESIGTTTGLCGDAPSANNTANVYGAGMAIIPYYRSSHFKSYMAFGGPAGGTTGGFNAIRFVSGACATTGAITQLALRPSVGPNFVVGSRFTIYGLGV